MGRRMNEKEKTDARRKTLGKKIAGGKWPEREREKEIQKGREEERERLREDEKVEKREGERGREEKGEEKEGGGRTVDTGKARRMGYGTRHTPS